MILNVYSVFDSKTMVFNTPFFSHNDGSAARSFKDLSLDVNSSVSRNKSDYKLYRIGSYDDFSGVLTPVSPVEFIATASDYDLLASKE